jgi:serine/threonine protein kinase
MLDDKFMSRLIDFGSSRAYSHDMSTDLTVILKKGFAPIEQYSRKGKHGPQEDVYAVCASMYYTMTGKVPPAAPDRRVFDTLQPIHNYSADIPTNIENIIMKGLSVQAEDRYQDMNALENAIDSSVNEKYEQSAVITSSKRKVNRSDDKHKVKGYTVNNTMKPQFVLLAAMGILLLILLVILISVL